MFTKLFKSIVWLIYFIPRGILLFHAIRFTNILKIDKLNLCAGTQRIPSYYNLDLGISSDLMIDLSITDLPFRNNSITAVICTSGINYFTYSRAQKIIRETYRVLKPGGIARFSVQNLKLLAQYYIENNSEFFFQKLPTGKERFEGATLGDKFVSFFYSYNTCGGSCKYVYDYESLSKLFKQAGFSIIEQKNFQESKLTNIELIDNRPDQMFFLEAIK